MSPPFLKVLKRGQIASIYDGPPAKRTRSSMRALDPCRIREVSPSKNVHFPNNLILGPTEIDPRRRSLSPSRSALRRNDKDIDSPSLQLLSEQNAAPAASGSRNPHPNTKQRRIAKAKGSSHVDEEAILEPPIDANLDDEPSSVLNGTHNDVCHSINELKLQVENFANDFPKNTESEALGSLLKSDNQQLIRYIGLLALGVKTGSAGWKEVLSESECRRALVSGIIGRALKEKVFDELCFGCDAELNKRLSEQEQDLVEKDGFFRTQQRAFIIVKYEKKSLTPAMVNKAVAQVTLQLERLLLPLWKQGNTAASWMISNNRNELTAIVKSAATLSHNMRKDFDTIYYWPPTFKDEEFEPERMECFNMANMIRKSPYDMKKSSSGYERPVVRQGHRHEDTALVRVVCFPGLVSYQQGGGYAAKQEVAAERNKARSNLSNEQHTRRAATQKGPRDAPTGEEGFRTRILCKAAVLLQWGNQRIRTREAGTSAHRNAIESGDRKYEKDEEGFVELYDLFLHATANQGNNSPQGTSPAPRRSWLSSFPLSFASSSSAQPEQS